MELEKLNSHVEELMLRISGACREFKETVGKDLNDSDLLSVELYVLSYTTGAVKQLMLTYGFERNEALDMFIKLYIEKGKTGARNSINSLKN